VYDSLKQHKNMKLTLDKLTEQISSQRVKQRQSLFLLGIGTTLFLCGSLFFVSGFKTLFSVFIGLGLLAWILGWFRSGNAQ
ncbi:MAG: ubiquinone biosynthesis regulatory protein kinase UbiB, partial [Proteus vulgaris]